MAGGLKNGLGVFTVVHGRKRHSGTLNTTGKIVVEPIDTEKGRRHMDSVVFVVSPQRKVVRKGVQHTEITPIQAYTQGYCRVPVEAAVSERDSR